MLSITKLQNLKAIHNSKSRDIVKALVVINRKTTKFESNSQPTNEWDEQNQSQNYKIWKQFTTTRRLANLSKRMLSITKLQNLKAIHNLDEVACCVLVDVINRKTTKFKSNSQLISLFQQGEAELLSITKLQNLKAIHNSSVLWKKLSLDVINHKTTKFESNSQLKLSASNIAISCYQSQNYKIWKRFTTSISCISNHSSLLSITKLQNLKAIHNKYIHALSLLLVVINHKTTKFESNSQRYSPYEEGYIGCYQSQNYKIWKQFTTNKWMKQQNKVLLSIAKLQNLKAIHNSRAGNWKTGKVVINHKTTKFESNSQQL